MNEIRGKRIDLHGHSFLSDGELLPSEILRRAEALDYEAIGVTDHADASVIESFIKKLVKAADELDKYPSKTKFYPGVELTHIPPEAVRSLASKAKKLGASLVVVHGETLVEPVKPGTNRAAVESGEVDILAHPGLITHVECELAKSNGVYLELSSRKGHCLSNGYVAKLASSIGVGLIVNSDFHSPSDLITQKHAYEIALGSGLNESQALKAVDDFPKALLRKISR